MTNKTDNIKNRVFGKGRKKEATLIDVWHQLMTAYGWIPYEEFIELDANLVNKLCFCINEDNKINDKSFGKK